MSETLSSQQVRTGFLLAIIGTLLFSCKSIFIKFLYLQGMNANAVLVLRMALSLPVYLLMLVYLSQREAFVKPKIKQLRSIVLLGFFGYYLASLFDLIGLEYITAQLERLSLFTYPFLVALLSFVLFKEPLSKRLLVALLLSYSGLWIVMSEELTLTGNNVWKGVGFVLASALSFAFYMVLSKRFIKQIGSQLFTCIAMLASCCFGLIHGAFVMDDADLDITLSAWGWLVMLVVFSTVIPSFLMSEAIQRLGSSQTGVVGMLGPIFTIAMAIYLLNEPFTFSIAIGSALIIIGVMSLVLKKSGSSSR